MKNHYQVLIVGGGAAGITVAAHLSNRADAPEIGIIEPSSKHYYQPYWTLVGAGVAPREVTEREEADFIPAGTDWIQDYVESFDPDNNSVTTRGGETITYDALVVSAGIQINWNKIPGLAESVGKAGTGVVSNYSYDTVEATWAAIQGVKSGRAIFTHPSTPIKCGGAPLKICYLAEDYWRNNGVRDNIEIVFAKGGGGIFAVPEYAKALMKVSDRKGIKNVWNVDLIELKVADKVAVFKHMGTGEVTEMAYDMIHVTPPMSSPSFIANSPLANEGGWVDVNKDTTQHNKYPNVFALGDNSSLPTSKTGAAIRKQAPTTAKNLMSFLHNQKLASTYNGYTSCPLVTGYRSLILAEFDYNKRPMETFPFDQAKERYSMYAMKAHGLPALYWHGMLRGRV